MLSKISQNSKSLYLYQGYRPLKQKSHKSFLNWLTVPSKFAMRVKHGSPVTQMRLDGKQVFVKAFDGFFLEDKVDSPSSVQHSHLKLRLLYLFCWYWGLNLITHLCRDRDEASKRTPTTMPTTTGGICFTPFRRTINYTCHTLGQTKREGGWAATYITCHNICSI